MKLSLRKLRDYYKTLSVKDIFHRFCKYIVQFGLFFCFMRGMVSSIIHYLFFKKSHYDFMLLTIMNGPYGALILLFKDNKYFKIIPAYHTLMINISWCSYVIINEYMHIHRKLVISDIKTYTISAILFNLWVFLNIMLHMFFPDLFTPQYIAFSIAYGLMSIFKDKVKAL